MPDFSHGKEARLKGLDGRKKKPLACDFRHGGVIVKVVKRRKQTDDTKPVGR